MSAITLWSLIFVVSLIVLVKSSDYFTGAAEQIGLMAGISHYIVGLTIVSIGTSLPELISSVVAVSKGSSEIVAGNVVGSNVANILLIIGFGAMLAKGLQITRDIIRVDLPLLLGSAFFLAMAVQDGAFSRGEAVLFIVALLVFVSYTIVDGRSGAGAIEDDEEKVPFNIKPVLILAGSAVGVYFGAQYTIDSVIALAEILEVGKEVVAVSAVAIGTSLPELAVTVSAVRRKNTEMVVGNVLGSNIFNTFAVMGIPALMGSLVVPSSLISTGVPLLIIATLLFLVATLDKRVSRWEGAMFMILYAFFIGTIFELL